VWQNKITGQIGVWFLDGTNQTSWSYFNPGVVPDTAWKIVGTSDFNSDGRPDLVWQNQASGQIGAWFLDGTTLLSVSFFNPGEVTDTSWKIVAVDDFNGDGKPDLVWQNQSNGQIGVWSLDGTTQTSWSYFTPDTVADTTWKIVPNIWNLTN
jgi:hypothetical protein